MIRLEHVYALAGLLFAGIALAIAFDREEPRRLRASAFYALIAGSFLFGGQLPAAANGALAVMLALMAASGALDRSTGPAPAAPAPDLSAWRLFAPALIIPVGALAGGLLLAKAKLFGAPLLDPASKSLPTLFGLAVGVLVALILAQSLLRRPVNEPVQASRGLMQLVGWAAFLPQMLAALGAVFALSGVGDAVSALTGQVIPVDNPYVVATAYCLGMALLTMLMGNAFAAFPVMTAGIGLPLIVGRFHGDPAVMGAIGMLSGFCGTLLTPLAANFNLVPSALLQLKDRYGVIRVQAATAGVVLIGNILLMCLLVYRNA